VQEGAEHAAGEELTAFLARYTPEFDRIIYVGDGSNDFCPVLRLRRSALPPHSYSTTDRLPRSQDVVLCRRYRGLEKKLAEHAADVKCGVKYWAGAWEVEELLAAIDK
jgi:pyridoxal phosphate phosphatase PHOSPHO2